MIEVAPKSDAEGHEKKQPPAINVSAFEGAGITELLQTVSERAKDLLPPPDQFAVNARQRMLLAEVAAALSACTDADDWLIIGENLRQARRSLDALTGRAHTEELLDNIFGKFCVGK